MEAAKFGVLTEKHYFCAAKEWKPMPLHRFIATPTPGTPATEALLKHIGQGADCADGNTDREPAVQLSFERYYGIGTFPVETSDELYRDDIIGSCRQKYGFDLTPYYYPHPAGANAEGESNLFRVTDLTARQQHQRRLRFKQDMNQLHYNRRHSHSSYFYIFIRPIQIMLIAGLVGYALYLSYKNEARMLDAQDEPIEQRDERYDEQY